MFKVGDRVRVARWGQFGHMLTIGIGDTGEVMAINEHGGIIVNPDDQHGVAVFEPDELEPIIGDPAPITEEQYRIWGALLEMMVTLGPDVIRAQASETLARLNAEWARQP